MQLEKLMSIETALPVLPCCPCYCSVPLKACPLSAEALACSNMCHGQPPSAQTIAHCILLIVLADPSTNAM